MSKLTLHPVHLASIASVVVAAAKKDPVSIIESVRLTAAAGTVTAVATDRYRVARSTFPVEGAGDFAATLPRDFVERFSRAVKAAKPAADAVVVLELVDELVTGTVDGVSVSGAVLKGNYPPVAKLFPDESALTEVSEVSLSFAFVADAGKLTHPALGATDRFAAGRIRFTKTSDVTKPGPVLIDRPSIAAKDGALEYLLQPILKLR